MSRHPSYDVLDHLDWSTEWLLKVIYIWSKHVTGLHHVDIRIWRWQLASTKLSYQFHVLEYSPHFSPQCPGRSPFEVLFPASSSSPKAIFHFAGPLAFSQRSFYCCCPDDGGTQGHAREDCAGVEYSGDFPVDKQSIPIIEYSLCIFVIAFHE